MLYLEEKYRGRNKFNIYNYKLTLSQLNEYIVNSILNDRTLRYIFTGNIESKEYNYLEMLRKFIPEEYLYREKQVLNNWDEEKNIIKILSKNVGFYSFLAEALMSYLNYLYLDNELITGVLSVKNTLTDQRTGVDVCMISDKTLILGEAKFYKSFQSGKKQIIKDFSSKSLISKLKNFYRNYNFHIKKIDGITKNYTYDKFLNLNFILSGFILHNTQSKYKYNDIDNISIKSSICNYDVIFYHLPIYSKTELIELTIKKALELIVNESKI